MVRDYLNFTPRLLPKLSTSKLSLVVIAVVVIVMVLVAFVVCYLSSSQKPIINIDDQVF